MRKGLGYYMLLPYAVEIIPIPEDQGGGYTVRLPQFGTMGIVGDGDTEIEALTNLKDVQCSRFQYYLSKDIGISELEGFKKEHLRRINSIWNLLDFKKCLDYQGM